MTTRRILASALVLLVASVANALPVDPAPAPPDYDMGVIVNGDFEADGGSLDGWRQIWGGAWIDDLQGNHAACMFGYEWFDPESGGPMPEIGGIAQAVEIPFGATTFNVVYAVTEYDSGELAVFVENTLIGQLRDTDDQWLTASLEIPDEKKGITTDVKFNVSGYEQGTEAYVDYVWITAMAPGDCNQDGDVDIDDLSLLASNWNTSSGMTWADGDFDGDGCVDINDLSLLATNWGTGSVAAVPEPASLSVLVLGGVLLRRRTHRRRP